MKMLTKEQIKQLSERLPIKGMPRSYMIDGLLAHALLAIDLMEAAEKLNSALIGYEDQCEAVAHFQKLKASLEGEK